MYCGLMMSFQQMHYHLFALSIIRYKTIPLLMILSQVKMFFMEVMVYVFKEIYIWMARKYFYVTLGSSYTGGQWAAGDEPQYYIVSPKDVVIAKPRSVSYSFICFAFLYDEWCMNIVVSAVNVRKLFSYSHTLVGT